jgi:hypothetical protein
MHAAEMLLLLRPGCAVLLLRRGSSTGWKRALSGLE